MEFSSFEKIYIIEFFGRYFLPEYMPEYLRKQKGLINMSDDLSGIIEEKTKVKNEVKRIIKTYINSSIRFCVESFNVSMLEVHKQEKVEVNNTGISTSKQIFSGEKTDLGRYKVSKYGVITTEEIKTTYIDGAENFFNDGKRAIRVPNYVLDDIKEGKNNKYFKLYNTKVYNPPYYSKHYLIEPNHIPNNGPVDLPIKPIPYDKNFVDKEVNLIYKAYQNQR